MNSQINISFQLFPADEIIFNDGDIVTIKSGTAFEARRIILLGSACITVEQGATLISDILFCSEESYVQTQSTAIFSGEIYTDYNSNQLSLYSAKAQIINEDFINQSIEALLEEYYYHLDLEQIY